MTKQEQDALIIQIKELKAQNDALKASKSGGPSGKVTEKGGVSFYGVGRYPVTLYKEQWLKLLANTDMISNFLKAHDTELSIKEKKATILKVVA